MAIRNKIYFASDFHLGTGTYASSRNREDRLVHWLDFIKADAAEVFLMGDVFDFWFEYKTVVPKGYIRFLGKLAELTDAGVKLYLFKGNHDMWTFDYFEKELGASIISNELKIERNGKKFFRSGFCQWLFARLHPNLGVGIANYWSTHSRLSNEKKEDPKPDEQEWLVSFCRDELKTNFYNYLVFGHRHLPLDIQLS